MSIYLAHGDGKPTQIASNKGWSDIVRYVEDLPPQYKTLKRLVDRGYDVKTRRIAFQFAHALENHPPDDETVAKTVSELIDVIGESEDVIMITNGLS